MDHVWMTGLPLDGAHEAASSHTLVSQDTLPGSDSPEQFYALWQVEHVLLPGM